MPSRILLLCFGIFSGLTGWHAWTTDGQSAVWLLPWVLGFAAIYVLSPQVDWWFYSRFPRKLDLIQRQMLETGCSFYQRLAPNQRIRFEQRCFLFLLATDFEGKAKSETLPEDFKLLAILPAVILKFGEEDFLFPGQEKIIIYPLAFPSPQYPTHWHHSEWYPLDGVLLFSAQALFQSFRNPSQHYPVAAHEWARVYMAEKKLGPWPGEDLSWWEMLHGISGWNQEFIKQCVGRPDLELSAVVMVHLLYFPREGAEHFPELQPFLRHSANANG